MGVQGLWDLLGVTGRRVEVEALGSKKVAVDASIWLVQFIKAMRNPDGTVMHNAHLLGMFRRLCKLLYIKVKPVVVFDGAAPVLKQKTIQNRRRQRQKGENHLRKIAEKMLLNRLRAEALNGPQPEAQQNPSPSEAQQNFNFSNPNRKKVAEGAWNSTKSDTNGPTEIAPRGGDKAGGGGGGRAKEDPGIGGSSSERSSAEKSREKQATAKGESSKKEAEKSEGTSKASTLDGKRTLGEVEQMEEEIEESEENMKEVEAKYGARVAVRLPQGADYHDVKNVLDELPLLTQYETLQQFKEERKATNRSVFAAVKDNADKYSDLQISNYLKTTSINGHIETVRAQLAGTHVLVAEDGTQVPAKRIVSDDKTEYILYRTGDPSGEKEKSEAQTATWRMPRDVNSESRKALASSGSSIVKGHTISMKSKAVDKKVSAGPKPMAAKINSKPPLPVQLNQTEAKVESEDDMEEVITVHPHREDKEPDIFASIFSSHSPPPSPITKRELAEVTGKVESEDSEWEDVIEGDGQAVEGKDVTVLPEEMQLKLALKRSMQKQYIDNSDPGTEIEDLADFQEAMRMSHADATKPVDVADDEEDDIQKALQLSRQHAVEAAANADARDDVDEDEELQIALALSRHDASQESVSGLGGMRKTSANGELVRPEGSKSLETQASDAPVDLHDESSDLEEMEEVEMPEAQVSNGREAALELKPHQAVGDSAGSDIAEEDVEDFTTALALSRGDQSEDPVPKQSSKKTSSSKSRLLPVHWHSKLLAWNGQKRVGNVELADSSNRPDMETRSFSRAAGNIKDATAKDPEALITKVESVQPGPVQAEAQTTCSMCKEGDDEGVMVCARCSYSAHSWCFYKGNQEAEDEAISQGDSWVCERCTGESSALQNQYVIVKEDEDDSQDSPKTASSKKRKSKYDAKKLVEEAGYFFQGGVLQKRNQKAREAPRPEHMGGSSHQLRHKKNHQLGKPGPSQDPSADDVEESDGGRRYSSAAPTNFAREAADQRALDELLSGEKEAFQAAKAKMKKSTEVVTDQMMLDVQELLELFGVPYVLSPTEAEAQCAELEKLELVDGIVTDDCDTFLFGGRNVFKNIFSEQKFVEWYRMETVESELRLNRDALIHLALLLGCDYCEGVRGVGIVNAVEILRAFPTEDDLIEFRKWMYSSGTYDWTQTCSEPSVIQAREDFADKHRRISRNWEVGTEFPSHAVVEAFLRPTVDHSNEPFEWAEPQVDALKVWCKDKFGWPFEQTEDIMRPVLAAHRQTVVQTRLDQFASFYKRAARIRSARVQKVVLELTKGQADADMLVDAPLNLVQAQAKQRSDSAANKKRKGRPAGPKSKKQKNGAGAEEGSADMTSEFLEKTDEHDKDSELNSAPAVESKSDPEDEELNLSDDEEFASALALSAGINAEEPQPSDTLEDEVETGEVSEYERQRLERVKANNSMLASLGLKDQPKEQNQTTAPKRKNKRNSGPEVTENLNPPTRSTRARKGASTDSAKDKESEPSPRSPTAAEEDEELQNAIAMSLKN